MKHCALWWSGIVAISMCLAGCATWRTPPQGVWCAEHWGFEGRMAVAMGREGFNAAVRWHKDGSAFDLALWGPFGAGAVQLEGQLQGPFAMTRNGRKQQYQALPEEVLWAELGVWFPVSLLQYWVLGREAPQWPAHWEHAPEGPVLQQAGFEVRYQDKDDVLGLPRRLVVTGQGARLKLFVRQWLLPAQCHDG